MDCAAPTKNSTNIVVLIALPEEHDVFLRQFPPCGDVSNGRQVRLQHESDIPGVTLTSVLATEMGSDAASSSAYSAVEDLHPDLMVVLGIAGSLSNDAGLGDVCVATEIIDVLHNSKVKDGGALKKRRPWTASKKRKRTQQTVAPKAEVELSPRNYSVVTPLPAGARWFRSHPIQKELYQKFLSGMATRWEKLIQDRGENPTLELEQDRRNDFHVGPIVCGPVSISSTFNEKLKDLNRKVLAIETESGGVFRVCQERGIPVTTIRGISDNADKNKKNLEKTLTLSLRELAMINATSFFEAMLHNIEFVNVATRHSNTRLNGAPKPVQESKQEEVLREAESNIRKHLDASSAEFKNRPFEAPLPLPRIKRASPGEEIAVDEDDRPVSIVDAITDERKVFIKIPRSYPEKNVAWYIGLALLKAEIDTKQVLPFIIDASEISPPRHGIRHALGPNFECLFDLGFAPVILISEPNFNSCTKMAFLTKELLSLGSIPIVVVSKSETPVEAIDAFKLEGSFTDFLTASVPLTEIATYLEQAFEMPPEEADVVATRLDETFSKFRLHTHPAYFIGLQESTLEALIDANQRAELIQLAVDGILSFVVANDRSDPKLSRTTREEFLSEIAFKIKVQKKSFTKSELVAEAERFGEEKALEIDSIEFIRGFIDFGLLNDIGHRMEFSLPFLEAFLLSEKLMRDTESALLYFDPTNSPFDQYTFDLYCERGPCPAVIKAITDFAQAAHARGGNEPNVFEGKAVRPRALQNSHTIVALAQKMGKASEKISSEASSAKIREEKQRLIDARDKVHSTVGNEERALRTELSLELKEEFDRLDALSLSTTLLATMIGSGAERLNATQKAHIGKLLLQVAERFLHHWTINRLRVNFEELRLDLLSEDSIKEIISQLELFTDREDEVRSSLSLFIDDQELRILSSPLATILHRISAYAGVRSIKPTVKDLVTNNVSESILRASWMMEIDPESGRTATRNALRTFKGSSLLRFTLASHLMWRIFWHHWQMSSKIVFADTAILVLRPLGLVPSESHKEKMLRGPSKR